MFEIYNHPIAIRSSFLRQRGIYHVYQTFSKHQPVIMLLQLFLCWRSKTPVICWVSSYFIMFYHVLSIYFSAWDPSVPGCSRPSPLHMATPPARRATHPPGAGAWPGTTPIFRTNSCCNRTKSLYVADYSNPQLYRNHMKQVQLATAGHITTNITLYPSVQYIYICMWYIAIHHNHRYPHLPRMKLCIYIYKSIFVYHGYPQTLICPLCCEIFWSILSWLQRPSC